MPIDAFMEFAPIATLEAAAIHTNDDGWVLLELHRLRLLVHISGREAPRDAL